MPRLLVALALLALAASCRNYDEPLRPLPDIKGATVDGKALNRAFFAGKPWVINVWLTQ